MGGVSVVSESRLGVGAVDKMSVELVYLELGGRVWGCGCQGVGGGGGGGKGSKGGEWKVSRSTQYLAGNCWRCHDFARKSVEASCVVGSRFRLEPVKAARRCGHANRTQITKMETVQRESRGTREWQVIV